MPDWQRLNSHGALLRMGNIVSHSCAEMMDPTPPLLPVSGLVGVTGVGARLSALPPLLPPEQVPNACWQPAPQWFAVVPQKPVGYMQHAEQSMHCQSRHGDHPLSASSLQQFTALQL